MTSPPTYCLAIDCGTQSIRALVFDLSGELIAKTQVAFESYKHPKPGWAEQHAHVFWDSLCRVCHKPWDETTIKPQQIAGLSVTTQRASIVCVDQRGEPLRPAIIWMDQRHATQLPTLSLWWKLAFRLAGVNSTVDQFCKDAEINWLREHDAQTLADIHKYLFLSGYLNFRLTGKFVDSVGSQVGYVPFDYKRHQWAKSTDWKWQACPVNPEWLPELIQVGDQMGEITEFAHKATGLPQGLPLFASAADKACETLGCGALQPHQGQISYGTTATLNVVTPNYLEPMKYLPPYPAAVPDHFTAEYQIYRGYWMVSWFKEQFAQQESLRAQAEGVVTETLLDEQAASISPGSDGLLLQPYWSPGVKYPGPEARGAIVGFTDQHTRAHMYRALLEGIAFGLFDGKQKMEKRHGKMLTELYVSGGGAQSHAARQITADIFNLPVHVPHTFETSGLGAAINVAVGMDFYANYSQAVEAMCHTQTTITPQQENVTIYRDLYENIYRKLYRQLSPLYQKLSSIKF